MNKLRVHFQKVVKSSDVLYRVERVLKRRKRGNKKEVLVKWDGWPTKFNSWIPESSLEKTYKQLTFNIRYQSG